WIAIGVTRLMANHRHLTIFESTPEVRVLCSAGIAQLQRSYDPVRLPSGPPKRPLSRGSSPAGHPAKPLVSFRINRQLSGWNLPPLMIRAFEAHCQKAT